MNGFLLRAAQLHSRYNPQAEAERYIDALNIDGGVKYFILIEPGFAYLVPALRRRHENSKIIVLHADSAFRETGDIPGIPVWYPDSGLTVQRFLEREIPDVGAALVRIVEWRPSLRIYGKSCLNLVSETAEFIKRADASHRTTAAFGKRWVRNFFKNIGRIHTALLFSPADTPVIITGSGPGLEQALPLIFEMKEQSFILAASSSLPALAQGGIRPDMVISTDGGSWALLHLFFCFRMPPDVSHNVNKLMLAAALSAALPSQCASLPLLALNDGSLWQRIVLNALKIPSVAVPQRGTVTASALDLALLFSSGGIYLAGMDLSVRDIRTHARPYGFDHLFYGSASRRRPLYSQCFARSARISAGGSHDVYAAWFRQQRSSWPNRIFSLGNNNAVFEDTGKPALPQRVPAPVPRENFQAAFVSGAAGGERCRQGAAALVAALGDSRYAKTLGEELSPLLFPDRPNISGGDLVEAIWKMAERYG
jgi:hypothetical protein